MKNDINVELRSEEVREIMGTIPSWILKWGITTIAIILFSLLVGICFFKYPDTLTGSIIITSSTPPVEINTHITGRLESLFVHDRQEIQKGENLAIIENGANLQDILRLNKILQAWRSGNLSLSSFYERLNKDNFRLGELQPLYSSFWGTLQNYIFYHRTNYYYKKLILKKNQLAQQAELDADRKNEYTLQQKLSGITKMTVKDSTLFIKEIKKVGIDNSKQSYLQDHNVQLNQKQIYIQRLQEKETLLDLEQQYREICNKSSIELNKASDQLDNAIKLWKKNYIISSPISGYVNLVGIWNKNQNVTAGELIMIIIPKKKILPIGKAKFSAVGIGKIQVGQRAIIKLSNYPDEEFGVIEGVVSGVSDIPDRDGNYTVDIMFPYNLNTNCGKTLPQTKQMLGNVQVVVKDKRLIEKIIQPVEKIFRDRI